ncbi:MAG: hypothetical protein EGP82_10165 [Odoribacter splanchnicus]|nr:hypothetical protein [Odoribacter splanchnicus]
MSLDSIAIVNKADLKKLIEEMAISRYEGRLVNGDTACQILGISRDTLRRWVNYKLIEYVDDREGAKKYDLSYLFSLDVKEIKRQYRQLNQ